MPFALRQSQKLEIPVKSVDWTIEALLAGKLPKGISSSGWHVHSLEQQAGPAAGPGSAPADAADSFEEGQHIVEDSESFGGEQRPERRLSMASISCGHPRQKGAVPPSHQP